MKFKVGDRVCGLHSPFKGEEYIVSSVVSDAFFEAPATWSSKGIATFRMMDFVLVSAATSQPGPLAAHTSANQHATYIPSIGEEVLVDTGPSQGLVFTVDKVDRASGRVYGYTKGNGLRWIFGFTEICPLPAGSVSTAQPALKLEVGRSYRTRGGAKVEILRIAGGERDEYVGRLDRDQELFRSGKDWYWLADGSFESYENDPTFLCHIVGLWSADEDFRGTTTKHYQDENTLTAEPECSCTGPIISFGFEHREDCAYMAFRAGRGK